FGQSDGLLQRFNGLFQRTTAIPRETVSNQMRQKRCLVLQMISYFKVHAKHLTARTLPNQKFTDLIQYESALIVVPCSQKMLERMAMVHNIIHSVPRWRKIGRAHV